MYTFKNLISDYNSNIDKNIATPVSSIEEGQMAVYDYITGYFHISSIKSMTTKLKWADRNWTTLRFASLTSSIASVEPDYCEKFMQVAIRFHLDKIGYNDIQVKTTGSVAEIHLVALTTEIKVKSCELLEYLRHISDRDFSKNELTAIELQYLLEKIKIDDNRNN